MAKLNQREKTMGVVILVIAVSFLHIYLAKTLAEKMRAKSAELIELEATAKEHQMGGDLADVIAEEKTWLGKVEPEPRSYENVQTELQKFLESSSGSVGLEPFSQKLMNEDVTALQGSHYRRAKIQISVQGDQDKILQWVTGIHQPDQFRAVTYLKFLPSKVEGELVCHLIAEQWLVPKT